LLRNIRANKDYFKLPLIHVTKNISKINFMKKSSILSR